MNRRIISPVCLVFLLASIIMSVSVMNGLAWSNGGYSDEPSNPDYGTHDWIAQHALDWLPTEEKQYILDYLAASDTTGSWASVRDTITGAWGEAMVGIGDAIYIARKS